MRAAIESALEQRLARWNHFWRRRKRPGHGFLCGYCDNHLLFAFISEGGRNQAGRRIQHLLLWRDSLRRCAGEGNVYRLGAKGLVNKFSFASNRLAGYAPMGDLLTAYVNGVRTMYGTTSAGGHGGGGTVYKLTENQLKPETWQLSVLHSFAGADGQSPMAGLTSDASGNLYGTTAQGGDWSCGTVFKLSPGKNNRWKFSVVYSFNPNNQDSGGDGCYPTSDVVLDAAGNIYGTTEYGGWYGWGTVYEITP